MENVDEKQKKKNIRVALSSMAKFQQEEFEGFRLIEQLPQMS